MKKIALVNQKGGVGKTTTAVNLAHFLAMAGHTVLLVDLDPQANASSGLGVRPAEADSGTYRALLDPQSATSCVETTSYPRLSILPATPDLAGATIDLAREPLALARVLESVDQKRDFEYAIIDPPPSLGPLSINALAAADSLVVPVQAEYYALEGIAHLLQSSQRVRQSLNPSLGTLGILMTMVDRRVNLARQVEQNVRDHFRHLVFRTVVPRNTKLSESPSFGAPIGAYAPRTAGAIAYQQLAEEVISRVKALEFGSRP